MKELSALERSIAPNFDYGRFELPENIALNFHLNPHHAATDLPPTSELDALIRDADIIIPEFTNDQVAIQTLRKVMAGNNAAYDHLRSGLVQRQTRSYTQALYSSFYASRAVAAVIDVSYFDPIRKKFNQTMDILEPLVSLNSSHADRVAAFPVELEMFGHAQTRDQSILENLKPVIEEVVSGNRKLLALRESRPLNVEVFYGSAHRSLFDALLAKYALTSVQGFSAAMSPESIEGDKQETLYARFLRNLPLTPDDVDHDYAYMLLNEQCRVSGVINADMSNKDFLALFNQYVQGLDLTDFPSLIVEFSARVINSRSNE